MFVAETLESVGLAPESTVRARARAAVGRGFFSRRSEEKKESAGLQEQGRSTEELNGEKAAL